LTRPKRAFPNGSMKVPKENIMIRISGGVAYTITAILFTFAA